MELQPLILSQVFYATLKELILAVNIFTAIQDYIVVKKKTKKN